MKTLLIVVFLFFCCCSYGQESYSEIIDRNVQQRVLIIKCRTDSLVKKTIGENVFSKLVADFGVTYYIGKFANNYKYLNATKVGPSDIFDLTQEYYIDDPELGLIDTIRVTYLEINYQFAPEANSLRVNYESNRDYLKLKALQYVYKASTREKLQKLMKRKSITTPRLVISVGARDSRYLVLVKHKLHYYPL